MASYLVTELLQLVHGSRAEQVGADGQRLSKLDIGRAQAGHNVPKLDCTLDLVFLKRAVDAVDDDASEEAAGNAYRHGHAGIIITYKSTESDPADAMYKLHPSFDINQIGTREVLIITNSGTHSLITIIDNT